MGSRQNAVSYQVPTEILVRSNALLHKGINIELHYLDGFPADRALGLVMMATKATVDRSRMLQLEPLTDHFPTLGQIGRGSRHLEIVNVHH